MTKDEALDLALEALELTWDSGMPHPNIMQVGKAITAIKQARALDKKAENARELGLDYEPADGTQVSKVWWDGEKLMAKPIPFVEFYKPVQELCRTDGRCQYAIDSGAEGMGHCPPGKCCMPAPVQEPVAKVAEVHMSRYTLEWTNGPLSEGTELFDRPAAQRQCEGCAKIAKP